MSLTQDLLQACKKRCPVCQTGRLFSFGLTVIDECEHCHAKLGDNDMGDGATVFMIFLLGFSLIPLGWVAELLWSPPMWAQVLVTGIISIIAIFTISPIIKAYIMALEYRHRPTGWGEKKSKD